MDGLQVFLVILLGVVSCSHDRISGSGLEITVRPGDDITLYCDCKASSGEYVVWYRNCSHENQPSLVLEPLHKSWRQTSNAAGFTNPIPRFYLVKNESFNSYDLLITNTTDSDGGLYYCGTKQLKVEDKELITTRHVYRYGNVTTRIIFNSSEPHHHKDHHMTSQDCGLCWTLLFSLCPAFAVLSSLLSSLLVHHLCQKTANEPVADEKRPETRGRTRGNQDEDVCYAALEIRQASQRPKKMKTKSSDLTTYSAINTRRM